MSTATRIRFSMRGNVLGKVAKADADGVKAAYWRSSTTSPPRPVRPRSTSPAPTPPRSPTSGAKYPRAVAGVLADLPVLTAYLRSPTAHHKRIRHTNLLERTFGQARRRVKVMGGLPGERTRLSLVWAVLDRASRGWRGRRHDPRQRAAAPTAARRPAVPAST